MTDCEICRNHEYCRLNNKDEIKNCFYVYPTEEYLATQTKEYKLGFSEAINKSIEAIEKRQKYLRENYALDVTAIAECEAIKILLQQLEK